MIPDIGLMIAVYIIARMSALIGRADTGWITRVWCWFAIIVTLISVGDLLYHGSSVPPLGRF